MQSLLSSLAVLAIMALGFYILVGGPKRWGLRRATGLVSDRERPRLVAGPLRDGVNALATVGLVFRFFANSTAAGTVDRNTAATAILVVLVGLAIIPDLQLLIGVAALTILFIEPGNAFSGPLLGAFVGGGVLHVLLRRLLGR